VVVVVVMFIVRSSLPSLNFRFLSFLLSILP
jgi:hypothetical protein